MARTIYGAEPFRLNSMDLNYEYDIIGNNSEVIAKYDIVRINSTNELVVGTTTAIGVAVKAQTLSSTNETVAKVAPGYIPFYVHNLFLMGTNSDLADNATDCGKYYKVTGATGAQQVDVAAGVATLLRRTVEIVQVDPFNEGGTGSGSGLRQVVVRFVQTPYTGIDTETA